MTKSTRWLISLIAAAACCFGIWQATRIGMGRTLAHRATVANDSTSADKAVRWSPNDAATHTARGIVLQRAGDYAAASSELQRATELRPRDYFPWMLLGVTRDLAGDQTGLPALSEAVARAPAYAKPHWFRGNVLLRAGQLDAAFQDLRLAASSDQALLPNVIDLAWGITRNDPDKTVALVQPQSDAARMTLAIFLARQKQGAPALVQFRAVSTLSDEAANTLLQDLLKARLFPEAYEVWARMHGTSPTAASLFNGSFEDQITIGNRAFGWQTRSDITGLTISIDGAQHQDGARSFRVDFHGASDPAAPLLSQLVLVAPNTKYRLAFQASTRDLVSPAQPMVVVTDVSDEKQNPLGQSLPLGGVDGWREFVIDFSTTAKTRAIALTLTRQPCASGPCAAFGTLWLDSFRLEIPR